MNISAALCLRKTVAIAGCKINSNVHPGFRVLWGCNPLSSLACSLKEWHSRVSLEIPVRFILLGIGRFLPFLLPGTLHRNTAAYRVQPHAAVAIVPDPPVALQVGTALIA